MTAKPQLNLVTARRRRRCDVELDDELAADDATRSRCPTQNVDLETVLAAWHTATLRLERTHETLCGEVARLNNELEIKNRELARKNRLADLGQMASHVAHEVRNNLVPVSLYMSLLRRRLSEDSGSLDILAKDRGRVYRPGRDRERSLKFHRPSSAAMANLSGRRPGRAKSASRSSRSSKPR